MWPTVRQGDVLLVQRDVPVELGDLVLIGTLDNEGLVAHRLVARADGKLRCANARGDLDPWVDGAMLFGRVRAIERDGKVLELPSEPRGMRLLWTLRRTYGLARRVKSGLARRVKSRLQRSFA